MKVKFLFVIAILAVIGIVFSNMAEGKEKKSDYVRVIYFHGDYRCATCNKLEELSKMTVEQHFAEEQKSGKVKFDIINVAKKENEHYTNEFNLYNQSLIVIKYKNGEKKEWKNCKKIWNLVRNEGKYLDYVKNEVKEYLKDI